MKSLQHTLGGSIELRGMGLHSGSQVSVRLHPAPENHGVVFRRVDHPETPSILASFAAVTDTRRGTTLAGDSGVVVKTVEHLLSSLSGFGISNVLVEVDGEEIPALDGSSQPFVDGIRSVGVVEQEAPAPMLTISEQCHYTCPESGAEYYADHSETLDLEVSLEFPSLSHIDPLTLKLNDAGTRYATEISPARTFCYSSELTYLRESGLIRGGTFENAVVIFDGEDSAALVFETIGAALPDVRVEIGEALTGGGYRFEDEPVRHKMLDLIGDLSLVGMPIVGSIRAVRPGHTGNIGFARFLKDRFGKQSEVSSRSRTSITTMDINQITSTIPHRYPFLLVDKVIEIDQEAGRIVGVKNVTVNEPFFQGHFPNFPIMPGVLIVEAMAQTGGLLLKGHIGDDDSKLAVFMGIREAKFRKPVVPGDTLHLELQLSGKKFNTYTMKGRATVDGKPVAQAEITVAVIDRGPTA